MCLGFFLFLNIFGTQLEYVFFCISFFLWILNIRDFAIIGSDDKCISRENYFIGIGKRPITVLLNYPVTEYLFRICRCGGSSGDSLRLISIILRIIRRIFSFAALFILDFDAVSSIQLAAPLCIQIQLANYIWFPRFRIIRISIRRDNLTIYDKSIKIIGMLQTGICIPSYQFVVIAFTADFSDLIVIVNVKVYGL